MDSITVEHQVRNGGSQQRNYGPHIWSGLLIFTTPPEQAWASKYPTRPEQMRKYLEAFATKYRTDDDPGSDEMAIFYAPRLVRLELIDSHPGLHVWDYRIEAPYMD